MLGLTNAIIAAIQIIMAVESQGNLNVKPGDFGQAHGVLQIHTEVIVDVNRVYGTSYTAADRNDAQKSVDICFLYLLHYAKPARLGRSPTIKDLCRIWNGGPDGHLKYCTLAYWEKAKKLIYWPS